MTGETTLPLDANGKMQFRIEHPSAEAMMALTEAAARSAAGQGPRTWRWGGLTFAGQLESLRTGPAFMDGVEWVEIEIQPVPVATGGALQRHPLARRTDPSTSRAAARSIDAGLQDIESKVLAAIAAAADGATWDEVSEATGLERATVSPRFKPLCEMGLIRANGTRKGKSGRRQTVWTRIPTA